jgi:hypothetical protein
VRKMPTWVLLFCWRPCCRRHLSWPRAGGIPILPGPRGASVRMIVASGLGGSFPAPARRRAVSPSAVGWHGENGSDKSAFSIPQVQDRHA